MKKLVVTGSGREVRATETQVEMFEFVYFTYDQYNDAKAARIIESKLMDLEDDLEDAEYARDDDEMDAVEDEIDALKWALDKLDQDYKMEYRYDGLVGTVVNVSAGIYDFITDKAKTIHDKVKEPRTRRTTSRRRDDDLRSDLRRATRRIEELEEKLERSQCKWASVTKEEPRRKRRIRL